MSAVWFPYTAIERLWCQLEELRSSGHMVEQSEKLQRLLHGALLNHLKQVGLVIFLLQISGLFDFCAVDVNLFSFPRFAGKGGLR